jgi:hypothetical protein
MRFIVGALALAVLGVLVGTPAAFVLGWSPLSASDRQKGSSSGKDGGAVAAKPEARAESEAEREPAG